MRMAAVLLRMAAVHLRMAAVLHSVTAGRKRVATVPLGVTEVSGWGTAWEGRFEGGPAERVRFFPGGPISR